MILSRIVSKFFFIYREKEFLQCNLLQVTMDSISFAFPNINCIFTLSWEISIGAMYRITLIFWCHMYSICKTHCFEIFEMKSYHYVPFPLNCYTHPSSCLSLYLVTIMQFQLWVLTLDQVCWKVTYTGKRKEKKEEFERGGWRPDVTVRLHLNG